METGRNDDKRPAPLYCGGMTRSIFPNSLKVWSLSLGCPKNRVDSERLLGSLGIAVQHVEHMGKARLVFINTCGFIDPAVRESVRAVVDAIQRLEKCKVKPLLAVGGCMVGRYGAADLAAELPEVDVWLPTGDLPRWPAMLAAATAQLWKVKSSRSSRRLRLSKRSLPKRSLLLLDIGMIPD